MRQAFDLAFDFDWSNANLFYGQYSRSRSHFNNSEMEATGLPSPEELAILEPLRDKVPAEVFTTEYQSPKNDTPQNRRKNLRAAAKLLDDAGWKVTQDGKQFRSQECQRRNALPSSSCSTRRCSSASHLPYKEQLELLGITVTIKSIDSAQYERQTQTFDYDIISNVWGQSLSPGNEQREFWGTAAADRNGSRNLAGIKDAAVDSIIETLIFAKDRPSLITACKALDRVLMWNRYMVPMWFLSYDRVAYWNRFGRPEKLPAYSNGFPTIWWWDDEKAKKTGGA